MKMPRLCSRIYLSVILTVLLVETANGNAYVKKHSSGNVAQSQISFLPNWNVCQRSCRAHRTCTAFSFLPHRPNFGTCVFFANAIGYGSLIASYALISGQFASAARNARLAWLGIGHIDNHNIRTWKKNFRLFHFGGLLDYAPELGAAPCEKFCSETKAALEGAECVQWFMDDARYFKNGKPCTLREKDCANRTRCYVSPMAYMRTPARYAAETMVGTLVGLNMSQTAVNGDTLLSRYTPNQFPPAPRPIGNRIPKYTEIDFHSLAGLKQWMPFKEGKASTWEECSTKCHQNPNCRSFLSAKSRDKPRECALFDGAILGRVHPGFDKYGVIDRSGKEGAVISLVPAVGNFYSASDYLHPKKLNFYGISNGLYIRGRILWLHKEVGSFDECARRCYYFYQPVYCIGFHYVATTKRCELYEGVPCANSRSHILDSDVGLGDLFYTWENSKLNNESVRDYRFGYIDGRVSADQIALMAKCQIPITTTTAEPETTTTAEKSCLSFAVSNAIVEPKEGTSIANGNEMSVSCEKGYSISQTKEEEKLFGVKNQTKISCNRGVLGNPQKPPTCEPFDKNEPLCRVINKYCSGNGTKSDDSCGLDEDNCKKADDKLKNVAKKHCTKTCAGIH